MTGQGYKVNHFPDGEKHLVLKDLNRKDMIHVICRIKSSDDLYMLMQLGDILQRNEIILSRLDIHYLMGMRMDRVIDFNACYSLKIIANVINSLGAKIVNIIEPHSDKTIRLINNACAKWTKNIFIPEKSIICYPDKGAADRSGNENALYCGKRRDADDGTVIESYVVNPEVFTGGTILVFDDLCDGGGTFVALAPILRELKPDKLILQVTHAIQKQGIEKVAKIYDEVYISNSYADWDIVDLPDNVFVNKL